MLRRLHEDDIEAIAEAATARAQARTWPAIRLRRCRIRPWVMLAMTVFMIAGAGVYAASIHRVDYGNIRDVLLSPHKIGELDFNETGKKILSVSAEWFDMAREAFFYLVGTPDKDPITKNQARDIQITPQLTVIELEPIEKPASKRPANTDAPTAEAATDTAEEN